MEHPIRLFSFLEEKSKDLKLSRIGFKLCIISFFSNLVTEVSLIVKVD